MSTRNNPILPACLSAILTVGIGLTTFVQGLAFWIAVVLPALYIPMAVADPTVIAELRAFWACVALHVVTLLVGHRYHVFDTRT